MADETLRIGFIGAGAINRTRHVPGLTKMPGVEFEVVANRSQPSSQAAADEYGQSTARRSGECFAPDRAAADSDHFFQHGLV